MKEEADKYQDNAVNRSHGATSLTDRSKQSADETTEKAKADMLSNYEVRDSCSPHQAMEIA